METWVKVFKNGPSKICERQPLKKFKGCLTQIIIGPFLNTLNHIRWFLNIHNMQWLNPVFSGSKRSCITLHLVSIKVRLQWEKKGTGVGHLAFLDTTSNQLQTLIDLMAGYCGSSPKHAVRVRDHLDTREKLTGQGHPRLCFKWNFSTTSFAICNNRIGFLAPIIPCNKFQRNWQNSLNNGN